MFQECQLFKYLFVLGLCCLVGCQQLDRIKTPWSSQEKDDDSIVDMKLAVARSMERTGKKQECFEIYTELAKTHGSATAYHRLGVLHDQEADFDAAANAYRKALEENPDNAEVLCDFGYSCYLQNNLNEGEELLRKAISVAPRMKRAHNNLGLLLAKQRRYDESLRAFSVAADNPGAARLNLSHALVINGDLDAARRFADDSLRYDGNQTAKRLLAAMDRAKSLTPHSNVAQASAIEEVPQVSTEPIEGWQRHRRAARSSSATADWASYDAPEQQDRHNPPDVDSSFQVVSLGEPTFEQGADGAEDRPRRPSVLSLDRDIRRLRVAPPTAQRTSERRERPDAAHGKRRATDRGAHRLPAETRPLWEPVPYFESELDSQG